MLVNRNVKEAIKVCEQYRGPVASVVKAGLLRYGHAREDIEKTIENAALYELDRLEKRIGVLATTANVAPMLGFLGTVSGMIKSFATLAEQGLTNPAAVAVGISEALITTATGLIIAIPAQLAYNWFTTKITRFVRDIETATNMLMETFIEMDSKQRRDRGHWLRRESAMALIRGRKANVEASIFTASMADIVFLLIIFFVLTYKVEVDRTQDGAPRQHGAREDPRG